MFIWSGGENRLTIKNTAGRDLLPAVRVRDNEDLAKNQVRVRYYSDYLLDKEFDDLSLAIDEIIDTLHKVTKL